jgi:uncharacterized protein YjbI with pentapeptide repeats
MTNLVQLAKLGNPQAIAEIINRQLKPKGIEARATLQGDCLKMHLESNRVLNKEPIVAWVRKGLSRLNPSGINRVQLQAWPTDAITLSWSHEFSLDSRTESLSLMDLAKRGDPDAIAALLDQTLAPQNITVQVRLSQGCLTVILEAPRVPDRATVEPILRYKLNQIKSPAFTTVNLEAKQIGAPFLAWNQPLTLHLPPKNPRPLDFKIGVSEIVLLGFSFVIFAVLCRVFHFNFFAGIFLALIPATIAHNRDRNFFYWYAYSLNLYFPAALHASFLKGFNPYGLIFFFLGATLAQSLSSSIGILLLIPNLAFALIPAVVVIAPKRERLNWYIYGIILFLVAFFHATLVRVGILKKFKYKKLEKVSFSSRDLTGANFQGSNLQGADFRNTKLFGVNFKNANLQNANFSDANIWATNFAQANLTGASFSRVSNPWKRRAKAGVETGIPWWIFVGLGLLVCQSLLWILFFGSPLGLILSERPQISEVFFLNRTSLMLSLFVGSIVAVLTLLTIVFGRQKFKIVLIILGLIGLGSIGFIFWSLLSSLSGGIASVNSIASSVSIAILGVSIWQAMQTLKKQQWIVYCTWLGIAIAMVSWAIVLAWGSAAVERYLFSMVPEQLSRSSLLTGMWFVATLAAWGAIAGNAIGLLAAKRVTCFQGANLTGANFTQAELTNVDFTGADLTDVHWTGVKLKNAIPSELGKQRR